MTEEIPDGTQTAVACKRCEAGTRLVVRTNNQNGSRFLGCPNFPDCRYTEEIPVAMLLELRGEPRLPGF